jgi:hypothetical protein
MDYKVGKLLKFIRLLNYPYFVQALGLIMVRINGYRKHIILVNEIGWFAKIHGMMIYL